LWFGNRQLFELYQATQAVTNDSKLRAALWASFVVTPADETLFVGIYRVKGRRLLDKDTPKQLENGINVAGSCYVYDLSLETTLSDLIGKLIIEWGDGARAWVQRPDNQNKRILELRPEFKEQDFPGFLNFLELLSRLSSLPHGWQTVLRNLRGVYLLTCTKTKEQYVGSATGVDGFWGRWQEYVQTGHGGNVALKSRELSDYQISILEVAGTSMSIEEIQNREQLWKAKLQSREMGLNRN
jgi:hypothetical protein